jgi:hypothetical protein
MVARMLRAADPVISADGERLRFEAFSQCCGVYARTDFLPDILAPRKFSKGTTDVDFNPTMRAVLARVRSREPLDLRVTRERVAVSTAVLTTIERRVKLPLRWVRGFGEVQLLAASLTLAVTLNGPQLRRFLSDLPHQVQAKGSVWLAQSSEGLRVSLRSGNGAVACAGLGRLRVMKPLARFAHALRVYAGAFGFIAFELDFGAARFLLALSAAPARGLSGEGQLLALLATTGASDALARVKARLSWRTDVDPARLAEHLEIPFESASAALHVLAAQGLVGFDPREKRYFQRELPFDLSKVESLHPRLQGARALSPPEQSNSKQAMAKPSLPGCEAKRSSTGFS